MYGISAVVCLGTLILYLITLSTVSYVGVYLTYVAIPVIVLSGLIMKCSTPKTETEKMLDAMLPTIKEIKYLFSSNK